MNCTLHICIKRVSQHFLPTFHMLIQNYLQIILTIFVHWFNFLRCFQKKNIKKNVRWILKYVRLNKNQKVKAQLRNICTNKKLWMFEFLSLLKICLIHNEKLRYLHKNSIYLNSWNSLNRNAIRNSSQME